MPNAVSQWSGFGELGQRERLMPDDSDQHWRKCQRAVYAAICDDVVLSPPTPFDHGSAIPADTVARKPRI